MLSLEPNQDRFNISSGLYRKSQDASLLFPFLHTCLNLLILFTVSPYETLFHMVYLFFTILLYPILLYSYLFIRHPLPFPIKFLFSSANSSRMKGGERWRKSWKVESSAACIGLAYCPLHSHRCIIHLFLCL